jgi:hypothetical protein
VPLDAVEDGVGLVADLAHLGNRFTPPTLESLEGTFAGHRFSGFYRGPV